MFGNSCLKVARELRESRSQARLDLPDICLIERVKLKRRDKIVIERIKLSK